MTFWDSSAVVALLVDEEATARLLALLEEESALTVWWGTGVECASALARRGRDVSLDAGAVDAAMADLLRMERAWIEVSPSSVLRDEARRLVRVHPLRAADALQLAAALSVADGDPADARFVCLDQRLAEAARREGFTVIA